MIKDEFGNRRFFGVYRGKVVSTADPLRKNRLKLLVPQVLNQEPTSWVWPREDASTKTQVPSIGQGVWVMFEGGDPSHPIWMGTFGKVEGAGSHVLIKPATTTPAPLVKVKSADGSSQLDLVASLVALANAVTALTARVAILESQMPEALNNGL
jgi:CubicO group peptidase (beta-lactamase class C family)